MLFPVGSHTIIPCTHHLPPFLCRPHCKRRQYHSPHRTHHRHVRSLRQRTDGISGMYLWHPAYIRRKHSDRQGKYQKPTPVNSIKKGIAFICEDRRRKAMIPSFTVEENMNLSSIDHYSKKGLFSTTAAVSAAKGMINALKIRCTGTSQPAC